MTKKGRQRKGSGQKEEEEEKRQKTQQRKGTKLKRHCLHITNRMQGNRNNAITKDTIK